MIVEIHSEARKEARNGAIWYNNYQQGLGEQFLEEITQILESISNNPAAFPLWPDTKTPVRRALLCRFPYAIAFEIQTETVFVLAIAHTKRRPFYWSSRI